MGYDESDKKTEDGLLRGLIRSAWPYTGLTWFGRYSCGTGATALGKSPGSGKSSNIVVA